MRTHHFGLVCPPGSSHVTGLTTVARELCRRGHRATVFNVLDVEDLAAREGIPFCAIGVKNHPKGAFRAFTETFGRLNGMKALRLGLKVALDELSMLLTEAPDAMQNAGVTALIVDQGQPAGSTIAERLGVPFVTLCNAVPADPDPLVPPSVVPWLPPTTFAGRARVRAAHWLFDAAATPLRNKINVFRRAWGFARLRSLYSTVSPLLEIAQQTEEFDFPRRFRPPQFHYIGLIRRTFSATTPFPFEQLDGRPIVYGSLGTVASDMHGTFQKLAEACADLNAQLVLTLSGKGDISQCAALPGNPVVVNYAPQLAILERSRVTVCHGGNNTVLESLASAVPVVAVPINTDQFGVGARLTHSRSGAAIALRDANRSHFRDVVGRLLSNGSYRERAQAMRASLERAGGERRAADLIEQALA
jgi:zeaxanthin glucosyltransferase